ncbi:MAG: hypothetical protein Q7U45_00100 [Burkholderiaceae bacterium]|nr:hypothetical protein [Burkholderiaceae bacterium]
MKFKTKVGKASGVGESTRTTVPKKIVELFKLKWGDDIVWTVETIDKDEIKVCISPKE